MKAVVYLRVSTEDQADKDLSLPSQERAVRDYASRERVELVEPPFTDAGESGTSIRRRTAFQDMLVFLREHRDVGAVLVYNYARFARNLYDAVVHEHLLAKLGVRVISVTQPIQDTPEGALLKTMVQAFDAYYSDVLARDVLRGMRHRAANGSWVGGNIPYGYRVERVDDPAGTVRRRLVPDPASAAVVRRIFAAYLQGVGPNQIAAGLNTDRIRAPEGGAWLRQTVLRILRNEVYTGALLWGRRQTKAGRVAPVRTPGSHEPVVDRETFAAVQQILDRRADLHPRRHRSDYLLSGLLRCGLCQGAYTGASARGKAKAMYRYYVCRRQSQGHCAGKSFSAPALERHLLRAVADNVLADDNLRTVTKELQASIARRLAEAGPTMTSLRAELRQLETGLGNLYRLAESGHAEHAVLGPRITELSLRRRQIEAELARLEREAATPPLDEAAALRFGRLARDLLLRADPQTLKAFFHRVLESIVIGPDGITVRYRYPTGPTNVGEPPDGGNGRDGPSSMGAVGGPCASVDKLSATRSPPLSPPHIILSCEIPLPS